MLISKYFTPSESYNIANCCQTLTALVLKLGFMKKSHDLKFFAIIVQPQSKPSYLAGLTGQLN